MELSIIEASYNHYYIYYRMNPVFPPLLYEKPISSPDFLISLNFSIIPFFREVLLSLQFLTFSPISFPLTHFSPLLMFSSFYAELT